MASTLLLGQSSWSGTIDNNGHRTYKLNTLASALSGDGPAIIMNTPGLPAVGSSWAFDNDTDQWAFCYPTMTVTPKIKNEPNTLWTIEQTFSTKPLKRCQDTTISDPLLEPQAISGSSVTKSTPPEDQLFDKDGEIIQSISFEPITGLEFDDNNHAVNIGQNVGTLGLSTITEMVNTVNDDVLWGYAARKIKLSNISWQRKLYGVCTFYYTRQFSFDINDDTWDLTRFEKGWKTLREKNAANPTDPDINDARDWEMATTKPKGDLINKAILLKADGSAANGAYNAKITTIQYYKESNFLLLGIPTTIGL
jgi:hypothetical protein